MSSNATIYAPSWILGRIEIAEMTKHIMKLKLMKNLFR